MFLVTEYCDTNHKQGLEILRIGSAREPSARQSETEADGHRRGLCPLLLQSRDKPAIGRSRVMECPLAVPEAMMPT